jgi:hypothetical protein
MQPRLTYVGKTPPTSPPPIEPVKITAPPPLLVESPKTDAPESTPELTTIKHPPLPSFTGVRKPNLIYLGYPRPDFVIRGRITISSNGLAERATANLVVSDPLLLRNEESG